MSNDSAAPRTATFDPTVHQALLSGGAGVINESTALVIDSDTMYEEGGVMVSQIKGSQKRIEEAKESLLKPVRELDRAIRAMFDPAIKAREAAEAGIKAKMIAYRQRRQDEALAAQRAAEETARKERERLEQQAVAAKAKADQEAAEATRKAAEAEAARVKAVAEGDAKAAAKAAGEAAKLTEQAAQKTEHGERQAAELSERAALTSVQVAAPAAAPKAAGTSVRMKWKARIKNKNALLASVMKNPEAFIHLVDINESKLNQMANAQGKGIEAVLDGIEAYQDMNLASKAA